MGRIDSHRTLRRYKVLSALLDRYREAKRDQTLALREQSQALKEIAVAIKESNNTNDTTHEII